MEKNKYSKILTISLIIIIVGILGTLGYFGYSLLNENKTKKQYTDAANDFEQMVLGGTSSTSSGTNNSLNVVNSSSEGNREKKYMEEYEIKGTIEIPKTKLKCAILNETVPRSLEMAVTVFYPPNSDVNVPGRNVILYGHNYRNSLFFSKNEQLENGDLIYILDQNGKKVTYKVYDTFETTSTDTSFYNSVLNKDEDKCEVTLSTCTDNASTTERRIIVRAREI